MALIRARALGEPAFVVAAGADGRVPGPGFGGGGGVGRAAVRLVVGAALRAVHVAGCSPRPEGGSRRLPPRELRSYIGRTAAPVPTYFGHPGPFPVPGGGVVAEVLSTLPARASAFRHAL